MPGEVSLRTVILTVSEAEFSPSEAVNLKVKTVSASTAGALKEVDQESGSTMTTCGAAGETWRHRYERGWPSGSEAVPDRVTVDLASTVLSALATADGGRLLAGTSLTVMATVSDSVLGPLVDLQKAQPVSFGHVMMAYYEMVGRDATAFSQVYASADVLPLGSGALAGATFPLDREFVAERLGFSRISANSMDAVSDRDFILDFIFAATKTMMHLSRLCEDVVIWSSEEFGFIRLSDAYSSGSSMMPQKRNPDYAELIRGKSGRVYGSLISVLTTLKGLPLTYNRDLQEDKPPLMDTADTVSACLAAARGMISEMTIVVDRMVQASQGREILATDYADHLVRKQGMPFREAYVAVAAHTRGESIAGIEMPEMTAEDSVGARDIPGGTAPARVRLAVMRAYGELGTARLAGEW